MSDQRTPWNPDTTAANFKAAADAFRCFARALEESRRRAPSWAAVTRPRGWPFLRA